MDKILRLYKYNGEEIDSSPFPNMEEQVIITDFQYEANRMGGSPTITATVKHRLCLDDLWTDNVYAYFNGEKYFLINTPSSNKGNDDLRFSHEIELLSEREILNHIYFIDAVQENSTVDVYKSNSTKVIFMGDINEFASRLNSSLSYSKVGYSVVVDEGITTEPKLVSFDGKYVMSALQEIFNIYEIPYYFVGKTIHIGYTENAIPNVFRYGFYGALLSISKQNANYEVVRRCSGVGSTENIPYYYPNESDDREYIESIGKKWITPSQNLMPSIYRETYGAERFYNAENNKYHDPDGGFYEFENLYSERKPNEKIVSFEDIKPSIVGMTNENGQRIDQFIDIAFDRDDNDDVDQEGNYIHPYFFVKLPKYNGVNGFNLFDQAIEDGVMTISMTSGVCGACSFEIGVGEETNKNIVQVDEFGNLKRDESGNVLHQDSIPQDRQNDTVNYEVWIALKKDQDTYGQIMPNAAQRLRPAVGDTFVILNIKLPQSYILEAEKRLDDSIIKYMFLNNTERFTFSVNFSRIYFAENPDVLSMMNENARIVIEYNGRQHTLYISSFSYKMSKDNPLPEISVELTDELSVGQNSFQNALESVKNDILSSIGGGDFLKQGLKYFLRKDIADIAQKKITFNEGLDVGNFKGDISGATIRIIQDGSTYGEIDRLRVRIKAYFETLEIQNVNSVGGKQIITAGGGVYVTKVADRETIDGQEVIWDYYRCYFLTQQDGRAIENRFHVGDLAISQNFNVKAGVSSDISNHYYWREVVGVGDDYIDLSKSVCDTGSDAPAVEDVICHLGNRTDIERQGAIILSAVDVLSPNVTLYQGIDDFSLSGKDYISYGIDNSTGESFFNVYGDMYVGDRGENTYMKYTTEEGVEVKGNFILNTGVDIITQFSIIEGLLRTEISSVRDEINSKDNYLRNSSFSDNIEYWDSSTDIYAFTVDGKLLYINSELYSNKKSFANIIQYGGKNVLRIKNSYILQKNSDFSVKPEFYLFEQDGKNLYRPRDFYISFTYMVKSSGTINILFENEETREDFEPYTKLSYSEILEETDGFSLFEKSFKWNGTGDLKLSFTGDMYLYSMAITDNKLADIETKYDALFEVTDQKIQANVEEIHKNGEKIESYRSEFLLTAQELNVRIENSEGDISSLRQTADSLSSKITNTEGDIALLEQKADSLSANISSVQGDVSTLQQTANSLGTRISNAENDISSIEQTASSLKTRVTNAEGDIASLEQTADSLEVKVSNAVGDISTLEQTVGGLKTRVTNSEGDISELRQTADSLSSSISSLSGDLSNVEQTANSLKTEITNARDGKSTLSQRFDSIESSVSSLSGDYSYLSIRVDGIQSVTNKINFDSSGNITNINKSGLVTTSNFSSLFSTQMTSNGVITSSSIGTYIKDGISGASIKADQIVFKGYTIINGSFIVDTYGNLTLKNITFSGTLNGGNATLENINAKNIRFSGSIDGTNATLKNITATNVNLSGKIKAESGQFGDDIYIWPSGVSTSDNDFSVDLTDNTTQFQLSKAYLQYVCRGYNGLTNFCTIRPYYDNITNLGVITVQAKADSKTRAIHVASGNCYFGGDVSVQGTFIAESFGEVKANGFYCNHRTVSSSAYISASDDFIKTTGNATLTFPSASSLSGKVIYIKGGGSITFTGALFIDAPSSSPVSRLTINGTNFMMAISDGLYWCIGFCG